MKTLTLAACIAITTSCATAPSTPAGPIELDGTKWKLLVIAGSIDGRVVQFKRKGKGAYVGNLVELGNKLRNAVGIHEGMEVFSLREKATNQYEGVYKAVSGSGDIAEKEVVVFFKHDSFTWNQENAQWERQ